MWLQQARYVFRYPEAVFTVHGIASTMKQVTFELGRLDALSDGVFAIALTLLVLDLKLPASVGPGDDLSFQQALIEQLPHILAWLLSFAILARLWIVQHSLLVNGDKRSRAFMTWNFVFLGAVTVVPFTTSLIAERHDQALSVIIFSVAMSLDGIALDRMWSVERSFFDAKAEADWAVASPRSSIVLILLVAATASLVALIYPSAGPFVWIAFPLAAPLLKRLVRKA